MSIRQILLPVATFPDAVPERTLEGAFALAQALSAGITAYLPQLNSDVATWPAIVGAFPLDFPDIMREMVARSEANAAAAATAMDRLSRDFTVGLDQRRNENTLYASADAVVHLARLHDLTILPVPETDSFERSWIEAVLFDSGHPVLLLPSRHKRLRWLDRVLVAWDYSREAARALTDALPILTQAREVHVVTVTGEKPIGAHHRAADLEKFLTAHRVPYELRQPALESGGIGECLMRQADIVNADLLVMGAYGRSRLREMVLGGATRQVLSDPLLPVLMSR